VRTVLVLTALILAGCAGGHQSLAVSVDGRAVLQDAKDGHLDRDWSCASLRAAVRRLPPGGGPGYSTIPSIIDLAGGEACDAALGTVQVGMRIAAVRLALGAPDRAARCWLFRWPPADAGQSVHVNPSKRRSSVDGARVCFSNGRVTRLQLGMHA
jgi:hypothetical protein